MAWFERRPFRNRRAGCCRGGVQSLLMIENVEHTCHTNSTSYLFRPFFLQAIVYAIILHKAISRFNILISTCEYIYTSILCSMYNMTKQF